MSETTIKASDRIANTIMAGTPVVYVVTWEEERLERMLSAVSSKMFGDERPVWQWSAARGFSNGPGSDLKLVDPIDALSFIIDENAEAICLMKDLPVHFEDNPALVRAIRDVYDFFSSKPGAVVMCHPWTIVPPVLSKEVFLLRLALPDEK